jgi:hypothetical protein
MIRRLAILAALVGVSACTDTERAKFSALGDPARVTCYSGGRATFDDFSTGKVMNPDGSDGYQFMSATSGRLVEASGDCVVDYGAVRPAGFKPVRP